MKKILIIITTLIFTLCLVCACTTAGEGDNSDEKDYTSDEKDYTKDRYLVENCTEGTINDGSSKPWFDGEILVCTSATQLKTYVDSDFDYDDSFFVSNSLLLIQFAYSTGEENISFEVLTSHEEKLYPVFSFDTSEEVGSDKNYLLFSVEVENSLLSSYEIGNILVIDEYNLSKYLFLNDNSVYHQGLKGVFDYYDQNDDFD